MTLQIRQLTDGRLRPSQDSAVLVAPAIGARRPPLAVCDLRTIACLLLAATAIMSALPLLGLNADMGFAHLFFMQGAQRFPNHLDLYVASLRDHGMVAVAVCIGCIGLALMRALPWNWPGIPARAAVFLTTAFILGPGLLVNGLLKPNWGRPRPGNVIEFGGALPYVDWWNPGGACPSNCSFVSGEAAAAAWLFGPAMLVPAPWRPLAVGATAAFFVFTSALRIAGGAHFLTDVLLGGLASVMVLLALRAMFYRTRKAG